MLVDVSLLAICEVFWLCFNVMTHPLTPAAGEGEVEVGFSRTHCVVASVSEAIEHVGLFDTVDCHARPMGSLAMTDRDVSLRST